jgi:ADP-ribosyl-[dinitrogen reductase] hydrolase
LRKIPGLTSGDSSERASGNRSIIRLAPVPIRFVDDFPADIKRPTELAAESSSPTHASPQCLAACRYFALILAGLIHGADRDEVLSALGWKALSPSEVAQRACT